MYQYKYKENAISVTFKKKLFLLLIRHTRKYFIFQTFDKSMHMIIGITKHGITTFSLPSTLPVEYEAFIQSDFYSYFNYYNLAGDRLCWDERGVMGAPTR